MSSVQLFYLILVFLTLEFAFSRLLALLNRRSWLKPLPAEISDLYPGDTFEKAKSYAGDKDTIETISGWFFFILTFVFFYFKGFAQIAVFAAALSTNAIIQGMVFFAVIAAVMFLVGLPFELYGTFRIEEKYGFNKTSPATFAADKLKEALLGLIIGGGIYALLAWLYQMLGAYFWIAGWLVVSGLSLFLAAFYTAVLLPVFNKLIPLESGSLRMQIEQYAAKVGFPLTNIMVMDGSKRSSKANAFFSGMGNRKTIVLFDTLIADMNGDEITAVLAHEVGHYKKKHILQSMVLGTLQMGVLFFLFGWLAHSPLMAGALGATQNTFYLSLVAFTLLYSPVSTLTGVFMNAFSRKNEYEADHYAKTTFGAGALIDALKKLYVNQLSNPQPDPLFVMVNYSHPTLLQRMRALAK